MSVSTSTNMNNSITDTKLLEIILLEDIDEINKFRKARVKFVTAHDGIVYGYFLATHETQKAALFGQIGIWEE